MPMGSIIRCVIFWKKSLQSIRWKFCICIYTISESRLSLLSTKGSIDLKSLEKTLKKYHDLSLHHRLKSSQTQFSVGYVCCCILCIINVSLKPSCHIIGSSVLCVIHGLHDNCIHWEITKSLVNVRDLSSSTRKIHSSLSRYGMNYHGKIYCGKKKLWGMDIYIQGNDQIPGRRDTFSVIVTQIFIKIELLSLWHISGLSK